MKVEPWGDIGILVSFDQPPSRELTSRVAGLAEAARELEYVIDAAPGYTTVLIEVESGRHQEVIAGLNGIAERAAPVRGMTFDIQITYDGEDLEWSCDQLHMSVEELIRAHSSKTYDVRLLGSPGFVYLSDVPDKLRLPRLERPRLEVPAGTVGIGGSQTGIYTRPRPGGWRLIGRAQHVPQLSPGDRVRFVPP